MYKEYTYTRIIYRKKKNLRTVSFWGVYFIGQEKLLLLSSFLPKVLVLGKMSKVLHEQLNSWDSVLCKVKCLNTSLPNQHSQGRGSNGRYSADKQWGCCNSTLSCTQAHVKPVLHTGCSTLSDSCQINFVKLKHFYLSINYWRILAMFSYNTSDNKKRHNLAFYQ